MKVVKKVLSYIYKSEKQKSGITQITILSILKFNLTNRRRNAIVGYLFILPWVIGFLWLTLYPIIMSFVYSLSTVTIPGTGGVRIDITGLNNYTAIFNDVAFIEALQAFAIQVLLYLPLSLIISLILAMLLNQKIRFKGAFRVVFFLPVIIASGPIMSTLFGSGERTGLLSIALNEDVPQRLASILPAFLAGFVSSLYTHLINILWFSGVQIILFLAGLQKVNKEVYEAASIDGASPWESFWKITLPSLKPIILVCAIYTIVMLATFSTNGVLYRINVVRQQSYGMASALAWVYFIVVALFLGVVTLLLVYEKKTEEKKILVEVKR